MFWIGWYAKGSSGLFHMLLPVSGLVVVMNAILDWLIFRNPFWIVWNVKGCSGLVYILKVVLYWLFHMLKVVLDWLLFWRLFIIGCWGLPDIWKVVLDWLTFSRLLLDCSIWCRIFWICWYVEVSFWFVYNNQTLFLDWLIC